MAASDEQIQRMGEMLATTLRSAIEGQAASTSAALQSFAASVQAQIGTATEQSRQAAEQAQRVQQQQVHQEGQRLGHAALQKSLVETLSKRIGSFAGKDFPGWKFKVNSAVRGENADLANYLKKTEENFEHEVDPKNWNVEDQKANAQFYNVLVEKTEGEAFDVVRNVLNENGAEAWRRLGARFDAKTFGKRIQLTRKCINPPRIKNLRDATAMIERWEDSVRRLKAEYQQDLEPGLKQAVLIEMVPSSLTETLISRMMKDDGYEETKTMVLLFLEQ